MQHGIFTHLITLLEFNCFLVNRSPCKEIAEASLGDDAALETAWVFVPLYCYAHLGLGRA